MLCVGPVGKYRLNQGSKHPIAGVVVVPGHHRITPVSCHSAICQGLADISSACLTECNHVFCKQCLDEWFQRARRCPVCNADLSNGPSSAAELKTACPLGWRVLARVVVRCPLVEGTGCKWKGMYSELHSHLTNSDEHGSEEGNASMATANALGLKEQANGHFTSHNYEEAIGLYTKAIGLCPEMVSLSWSARTNVYT